MGNHHEMSQTLDKLLTSSSRYYIIFFSDMACSVAGITSDANVLTNELRLAAQRLVIFLI